MDTDTDISSSGAPLSSLRLMRLPGERGSILRCVGELSGATAEGFRREAALLAQLGGPTFMLDLSGCRIADLDGAHAVVEVCRQLRNQGSQPILVGAEDNTALALEWMGAAGIVRMTPTEEAGLGLLRSDTCRGRQPAALSDPRRRSSAAPSEESPPLQNSEY